MAQEPGARTDKSEGRDGALLATGDDLKRDDANCSGSDPLWVGSSDPDGCGLYDMARNVAEWVTDCLDNDYHERSPKDNPKGLEKQAI